MAGIINSENIIWKTDAFRSNILSKIEQAIFLCGSLATKNEMEMETEAFTKAKTKNEYLSFVAKLIIHIKDFGSKKNQLSGGGQRIVGITDPMSHIKLEPMEQVMLNMLKKGEEESGEGPLINNNYDDEFHAIGETIAHKLRKMDANTKFISSDCESEIFGILHQAEVKQQEMVTIFPKVKMLSPPSKAQDEFEAIGKTIAHKLRKISATDLKLSLECQLRIRNTLYHYCRRN